VYEREFLWKEIFCAYVMRAEISTNLTTGKGKLSAPLLKEVLKEGAS
jgi:hypothetical protein